MTVKNYSSTDILENDLYKIETLIGEGGYGLVYKAIQNNTGKTVALKTLKTQHDISPIKQQQLFDRFERETALCANINHPNIVQLIDKGYTENKLPYAVFEYVEGVTLKEYLITNQGLEAPEMAQIMLQILNGLVYAHEKGIVHRDLKPQNIMITFTGVEPVAKILDFGIGAFVQGGRTQDYKSITLAQDTLGTPTYSAPEQLRGDKASAKSDLYTFGLIVLECLTGRPVMEGESLAEIVHRQLMTSNIPFPPAIIGHPLADLLRRLLEKNPEKRLSDTREVYQTFKRINFDTLSGKIKTEASTASSPHDQTLVGNLLWSHGAASKKQLITLCIRLSIKMDDSKPVDTDLLDAYQSDQLNLLRDTAIRFGGHTSEPYMNYLTVFFGYPSSSDTDARRAGRTALELINRVRRRNNLLKAQYGIKFNLQIGIHTGKVLINKNQIPQGLVPNTALDLAFYASSSSVLVSKASKKLLDPYFEFQEHNEPSEFSFETYELVGEHQLDPYSSLQSLDVHKKMIGRIEEKKQALEIWNTHHLNKEPKEAILIKGQAGIGKSRLLYEVKREILAGNNKIVECRCLPEHSNTGLYPFLNMLRNSLGIVEQLENQSSNHIELLERALENTSCDISESLPILCSWLSLPLDNKYTASAKPAEEQKQILFETLTSYLCSLSTKEHFLIIIEDIHWSDPTTCLFVDYLINHEQKSVYTLLMSSRITDHNTLIDNKPSIHTITLSPLGKGEIKELIESVTSIPISIKAEEYIVNKTDGIPLYTEEMTRMLLENKHLIYQFEANVYDLVDQINSLQIPSTLQNLLQARLDNRGAAKETAQLAAVIGREFDYDLLLSASTKDSFTVQNEINELVESGLVFKVQKIDKQIYFFRHALIRDAAYDSMLKKHKVQLHGSIASTLEHQFINLLEENRFTIANHYAQAEKFKEALDHGISCIKNQVLKYSNTEALGTYQSILPWLRVKSISTNDRIESELILNEAILPAQMAKTGFGSPEVQAINQKNEKLIKDIKNIDSALSNEVISRMVHKTEWGLFLNYLFYSKRVKAHELATNILDRLGLTENFYTSQTPSESDIQLLKENPNRDILIGVLPLIAQAFQANGLLNQSTNLCTIILGIYKEETDIKIGIDYNMEAKSAAYYFTSSIYFYQGKVDTAISEAQKGIAWAKKINHPTSVALAYTFYALIACFLEDKDLLNSILEDHQEYSKDNPADDWALAHLNMIADWGNGATTFAEQYVDGILGSNQSYALSWYEPSLANTYLDKGDIDKSIELMEKSLDRISKADEVWGISAVRNTLAKGYFKKDGTLSPRVINELEIARSFAAQTGALWYELEAQVILLDFHHLSNQKISLERITELKNILQKFLPEEDNTLIQKAKLLSNINKIIND